MERSSHVNSEMSYQLKLLPERFEKNSRKLVGFYLNIKKRHEGLKCNRCRPLASHNKYNLLIKIFDQQGFAEAKAYKKPGKIYCCSTFRGHRDSIIKTLVK